MPKEGFQIISYRIRRHAPCCSREEVPGWCPLSAVMLHWRAVPTFLIGVACRSSACARGSAPGLSVEFMVCFPDNDHSIL
jgi:hypothetical protein